MTLPSPPPSADIGLCPPPADGATEPHTLPPARPDTAAPDTFIPLPAPRTLEGRAVPAAALAEGHRRAALLDAFDALKAEHPELSYERAARILGVKLLQLWRLVKRREAGLPMAPQFQRRGRKATRHDLETLLDLEAVRAKLDTLYVATLGASSELAAAGRRTGKVSVTLQRFAEEPECPPDLAARLAAGQQPAALVRYLRRITPEMEARIRGEKNFKLNGIVSRRDDTVRLPNGDRAAIVPGYLVEFDDMSVNQPFHVELPDGTHLLSRQGLYARDVKSGRWLGFDLVARPREAYRAEDILRFLRKLMFIYGKFSVLRLERGIWAARSLRGWRQEDHGAAEEEFARPEMDRAEQAKLSEGLEAIGVRVQYVTSAHRKGALESSFNHLQTILATYTSDLNNVGRYPGEFEAVEKRNRQARNGRSPAELGFAPIDLLADRIWRAMDFVNRRPHTAGTAYEQWDRGVAARALPRLTEIDLAAFLPEMRPRRVAGGRVTCIVEGRPHDFRADIFAKLGAGYRVFVKFDPAEPVLGAAIYNRETSSANHLGLRPGEFITFARWEMPGPQLEAERADGLPLVAARELYCGLGPLQDDGYARRRAQEKFVRAAFRALPRPGQPAVGIAEIRDGRGSFARVVENGARPAEDAAAVAPLALPAPAPAPARADTFAEMFGG